MAQKTIKLNGVDISSLVTQAGYSVKYIKRHGDAEGMMLDGKITEDILAIKAVVTVPLLPISGENVTLLLYNIYDQDYPNLYYYDPLAGAYKTIATIIDEAQAQHLGANINSEDVWKSPTLTFTER